MIVLELVTQGDLKKFLENRQPSYVICIHA